MGVFHEWQENIQFDRKVKPDKRKPEIIFCDDDILVVNKPAGLLTIPDRFHPEKPNLIQILRQSHPTILLVHRIDKDTSGLLVFALNAAAHSTLSQAFESRSIDKQYLAVVKGTSLPESGSIDFSLASDSVNSGKMKVVKNGKPSLTHFKVKQRFKMATLVELSPKTGRTHQIRVHMAALQHPLLIDPLYSTPNPVFMSDIKPFFKSGLDDTHFPIIDRLTLHAWRLQFSHPTSGDNCQFEAPLPKDLRVLISALEKWA